MASPLVKAQGDRMRQDSQTVELIACEDTEVDKGPPWVGPVESFDLKVAQGDMDKTQKNCCGRRTLGGHSKIVGEACDASVLAEPGTLP